MAKVLLVEDDNNLREIYEARLLAEGYEIVSAQDGEEALALAVKERPDLIIADIMMPKISGFDMLDILRSTNETKDTKVIMMTALSQAEDKERANKLGADRYLVKSQVTLEDVAKVAHEVLEGKSPGGPAAPAPTTNSNDTTTPPVTTAAADSPSPKPEEPITASLPTPTPQSDTSDPVQGQDLPSDTPLSMTPSTPEPLAITPAPDSPSPSNLSPSTSNNTAPMSSMPITTVAPTPKPASSIGDNAIAKDEEAIALQLGQAQNSPTQPPGKPIQDFVDHPAGATVVSMPMPPALLKPDASGTASAAASPAPAPVETDNKISQQENNDGVLADAMATVNGNKPDDNANSIGRHSVAVAENTGNSSSGSGKNSELNDKTVVHTKTISPINDLHKQSASIEALLAEEAAKEDAANGEGNSAVIAEVTGKPQAPIDPTIQTITPTQAPESDVATADPSSIAL